MGSTNITWGFLGPGPGPIQITKKNGNPFL